VDSCGASGRLVRFIVHVLPAGNVRLEAEAQRGKHLRIKVSELCIRVV
jgi:hypothetical protein